MKLVLGSVSRIDGLFLPLSSSSSSYLVSAVAFFLSFVIWDEVEKGSLGEIPTGTERERPTYYHPNKRSGGKKKKPAGRNIK